MVSKPSRGFTLFELCVVIVLLGLISSIGLRYMQNYVYSAERAALTTVANSFGTTVNLLRNKWIVEGGHPGVSADSPNSVLLEQSRIYLTHKGWPVSMESNRKVTAEGCLQLWQATTQLPLSARLKTAPKLAKKAQFLVSVKGLYRCRVELAGHPNNSHYFDYSTVDGSVTVQMPLQI